MRIKALMFCSALIAATLSLPAGAAFPDRPITIVAPFSAGGSTDATARLLAEGLGKELGQSVVIENRPGAGGNIGAGIVAQAKPDGYTMLMATSTHATNASLYKDLNYDLLKDLAPVSQTAFIPNVLVVNKDYKAKTLNDLVELVKSGAKDINYGSAGNGSSQHLSGAQFNHMLGGNMVHVPYKGGAPANQDLLAGRIQVIFSPLVEILPYLDSGRLVALGVTTPQRSAKLPDVPAIGEVLPGYEAVLWNGLFVPAGTPPEIVKTLSEAVKRVLDSPKVKEIFDSQGTIAVGNTPEEFAELLPGEVKKWGELVKISGAKID